MFLNELVKPIVQKVVYGTLDIEVLDITEDSRKVRPGTVFLAIRGDHVDGHHYIEQAVARGAVGIIAEKKVEIASVTQVIVPSTHRIAALLAQLAFDYPTRAMTVVGVTGTNGKTTTTMLIEAILKRAGKKTGLIGTIVQRTSVGELRTSSMTTPPAIELTRTLREMRDLGTEYVAMEVSSHALEQGRVAGISYRVAAFTNLTQDHLDFHQTMERYARAKGKFFSRLGNSYDPLADGGLPVAVLNADDEQSDAYLAESVQQVITYGMHHAADVVATDVSITATGASFHLKTFAGSADLSIHTPGRFSVYNALCATACCLGLGISLRTIVETLKDVPGVPGRFERVLAGQPYTIIVDYSHTPDSLLNALTTIHEFATNRVITVVGCGGDRDKTKRPLMAQVATEYSDLTVLTSDNPRTEDPEKILDDMEAGLSGRDAAYVRIVSREEGIRHALMEAKAGDVVLIAGKGHETYQIIGTTYHDFDDRVIASEIVRGER